jgi:hypothetical protein
MIVDYVYRRTRGSPLLSDANKAERYIFCKNNEFNTFKDYLFIDEATVRMLEVPLYHIRKRGKRPEIVPHNGKAKIKINVWGGISFNGPTQFSVFFTKIFFINITECVLEAFKCNLNSDLYCDIMRNYVFPFSRKFYPNGLNIHQDNSPIHHSQKAKTIVENMRGITWVCLFST